MGMERGVAASSKKQVQRRSAAVGLVDSEKRQAAGGAEIEEQQHG